MTFMPRCAPDMLQEEDPDMGGLASRSRYQEAGKHRLFYGHRRDNRPVRGQ